MFNVELLSKARLKVIFISAESRHMYSNYQKLLVTCLSLTSVIFNEVHCISTWGVFQPECREVGCLCYILPKKFPSWSYQPLHPLVFNHVNEILQLQFDKLTSPQFSNLWSVQLTHEWHWTPMHASPWQDSQYHLHTSLWQNHISNSDQIA
jgi:hypothetical protein